MGQILSLIIIGLGGWVLFRFLSGGGSSGKPGKPQKQAPIDPKDLPKLKKDPKTGIYRPEDD